MPERRRVRVRADGHPESLPSSRAEAAALGEQPEVDDDGCNCPQLDPEDWHEVESDWSDITFLQASTGAVLGVPTGLKDVRDDLRAKALKLGATVPEDAMLLLGEGRFRRPVLLEIEGGTEGHEKEVLQPGGVAFTRLVPAPIGGMKKAVDETRRLGRERYGRDPSETWLWYITCRICSRPRNFETLVVAHYPDPSRKP